MATFYIDYEGGDDNNGGDSFAVTASGTDGVTNGTTTFTSASASWTSALIGRYINIVTKGLYTITAVGSGTSLTLALISGGASNPSTGSSLTYKIGGRWKTITTGAAAARISPGDTCRLMASPTPTSLGQTATWTNGPIGSSKNITAASNASPIVVTSASHGYTNGKWVYIASVAGNTAANELWKIQNVATNTFELVGSTGSGDYTSGGTVFDCTCCVVELTTAVTANVTTCETAWTASANVTSTADATQYKQGVTSAKHVIAAGFTTGLASYFATGTIDFSSYKQISFWIRNSVAVPASSLSIKLCSDTAGVTAVDTFAVPAIPSINQWVPITVDKGSALGSSIKSVALYVDSDFGAVDIYLDNIIACKDSTSADSLSLTSLIGKNSGSETWYGIQSISSSAIKLDNITNTLASAGRGYSGTTETVTTYKRETIKRSMAASLSTAIETLADSGTFGNLMTFSGGWDRTNMSSQTDKTWMDGQNGNGVYYGDPFALGYLAFDTLGIVRFNTALNLLRNNLFITSCEANNVTIGFVNGGSGGNCFGTIASCISNNTSSFGFRIQSTIEINDCVANNSLATGFQFDTPGSRKCARLVANNSPSGFIISNYGPVFLNSCTTRDNSTSAIAMSVSGAFAVNCLFLESVEIATFSAFNNSRFISINHDQTTGNHQIFTDGGLISSEASIRHTASGISWKMSPTSSNRRSTYPLDYVVSRVAVAANSAVTVSLWMRRTNTGLTAQLVCRGGQISGVAADVSASMTAAADTWEQVSISFTPTEAGVVEIEAWAYGGTTYSLYIDDLTVSQ